jgi:hypothetical protein
VHRLQGLVGTNPAVSTQEKDGTDCTSHQQFQRLGSPLQEGLTTPSF